MNLCMLTKKVIAANITNLTDARYFAARGVDFLLFDLSQVSLDKVFEIKEWVEGPRSLLLFDEETLPLLDEAVIKIDPFAIGARSDKVISEISYMSAHIVILDWTDANRIRMDEEEFFVLQEELALRELSASDGIILSGEKENTVGLKDFESMDRLLDLLEH